jgi:hypothetical protein
MANESAEGWDISKAAVETYNAEYSAQEAFLLCLIDGSKADKSLEDSRARRLSAALWAVFGHKRERMDDPSETDGRALYRMAELAYDDYLAQLLPEHGGPPLDAPLVPERTANKLAAQVVKEMGLDPSAQDRLQRKFSATYKGSPEGLLYSALHISRQCNFDPGLESQMASDFVEISRILDKYGIKLRLDKVFWRTQRENPAAFPRT